MSSCKDDPNAFKYEMKKEAEEDREVTLVKCSDCGVIFPADQKHTCDAKVLFGYQNGRADAFDEMITLCRKQSYTVHSEEFAYILEKWKEREEYYGKDE